MSTVERIPASKPITKDGWVGSESDLEKLIKFFEDVRNEVVQSVDNGLELATNEIRAEQEQRFSYLNDEERARRVETATQSVKDDVRGGVELTMTLTEEVRYPANSPRRVLEAADLAGTRSFSLDVTTDHRSRPYANHAAVSLDVRATGVSGTITSSDRTFREGTFAGLEKLLNTTQPPKQWMASTWFAIVTSIVFSVVALGSALYFLSRFTSSEDGDAVASSAMVTAVVVLLVVTIHGFLWNRWLKNFPPVQVYRDGGKPTAERANRVLTKATIWTVGVVLVPVLLAIIFGS